MKRAVILISGRGSNMERLIHAGRQGELAGTRIVAVLANRHDARGLACAAAAGIPVAVVDHGDYPDRESFDAALAVVIDRHQPDLVLLAGFMRILSEGFVRHCAGRLMNIHPSLLPAFPGLHTHRRALEAGVRLHGCTAHFVTPALDHGPIILQAAVPVLDGDDEDTLAARVLAEEHRIYPLAVRWFAEGRLRIAGQRVEVRGRQREDALYAPRLLA
jgi:phosphoribosylglycinamide formyltransferase-1